MQKEKKINICLFLVVCLFCLIIFEIVSFFFITVCVTYRACPKAEYSTETIEFNMGVKLNSDGFRDDEFSSVNKDSVAIIGDSFVFGWGVEENQSFAHLIEEKARRELKRNDNYILNLGIEGTAMEQYAHSLKKYGKKSETIVLIYNPASDVLIRENQKSWKSYIVEVCSKLNSCNLAHKAYFKLTNKNLGPSGIANSLLKKNLKEFKNVDLKYVNWALEWKINPFVILAPLEQPYLTKHYKQVTTSFDEIQLNKKELDEFITWAQKREKKVIVVLMPQSIAVSDAYIQELQNIGFLDSDEEMKRVVCNTALFDKIKTFLSGYNNIKIIDLQEEMCRISMADQFYYNLDWHLTPLGNEFVADIIYETLSKNKTIQQKNTDNIFYKNPYQLN